MKKNCHRISTYVSLFLMIFMMMVVFTSGCTKTELQDDTEETDKILPTIVSVDPENNVNTVSLTAKATVIFSEAMNEETVNTASFKVKKGETDLPGTISYSGKIATFSPSAPFEAKTQYTCIINNSVKDVAGNALASNHTWSFTTVGNAETSAPTVLSVLPAGNATSVATSTNPSVTFSKPMNSSTINSASFILKKGSTVLQGTVSVSGNTATLDPAAALESNTLYTCTVTTSVKDATGNALATNYTWSFTTAAQVDVTPPSVLSAAPAGNSTSVPINVRPSVTFSEAMNSSTITSASFNLKRGTTTVTGTVNYSGTTATFTPSANLAPATLYTATITTAVKDAAGNALVSVYTWSFTTAAQADLTAPSVLSSTPSGNAASVAVSIRPSVIFSEAMNPATITSASFTLKRGTTSVTGTVSYSGTTATFTPSANLAPATVYTATITTAVRDAAGNAMVSAYTFNFTTAAQADQTAPSVLSSAPSNNATSVAINVKPSVIFSEAMNPATITSASFTLKRGTTTVTGTVSYSGTTATFTPSANLAPATVYTATITRSVNDVAGNAMVSDYTWSFTTAAATVSPKSFAVDVVPILNKCNTCHRHNWTASSTPSVFHTNLVNSGHINLSTPTSGRIYREVSGGHPSSTVTSAEKTALLTWITEGSKNN